MTTTSNNSRVDAALALLRVVLGGTFIAHGAQKLFVFGLAGVTGAFGGMGVPMPGFTGPATAFVEFFGGIAIVLGMLTRLSALGVGITMLGAIFLVHLPAGFFAPKGVEFPLALLAMAISLVLTGAGKYSLDALISRRRAPAVAGAQPQSAPSTRRAA